MPGHKGNNVLGIEDLDITEISGADNLYSPESIILESENNASALFGSYHTYYSAGGSTQCIKAMLAAVCEGKDGKILAGRNAHKAFLYAAAQLDLEVCWLYGEPEHLCALSLTENEVENQLKVGNFDAVYLTSPDYLGNITDVAAISKVCRKYGVPLLLDNAHGAYLKFLKPSMHPIDLGADMCCDSAHKTLPVLTGGAYLHVKTEKYADKIRKYMSLFGSTSPSYLIMASLDLCNPYLAQQAEDELQKTVIKLNRIKETAKRSGFILTECEPLKICVNLPLSGYTKQEFLVSLGNLCIEPEFCDRDFAVFMASPKNSEEDFARLEELFTKNTSKAPIVVCYPYISVGEKRMSIRKALFAESESIKIQNSEG